MFLGSHCWFTIGDMAAAWTCCLDVAVGLSVCLQTDIASSSRRMAWQTNSSICSISIRWKTVTPPFTTPSLVHYETSPFLVTPSSKTIIHCNWDQNMLGTTRWFRGAPDQCSLKIFKVSVCRTFLLCNILPDLIWIWNDEYEIYMYRNIFGRNIHVCSKFYSLCFVSWLVCMRTRAQLRENIAPDLSQC